MEKEDQAEADRYERDSKKTIKWQLPHCVEPQG